MTIFADTHCHLDLYPDPDKVARECEGRGIKVITVTNTPRDWKTVSTRFASYKNIRVALGLHPQLVASDGQELDYFLEMLPQARYIGEVGLDGSKEASASLPKQKRVFQKILRACAEHEGKVLSVHSRGAVKDAIDMIQTELKGKQNKVILHWFTGSATQMIKAAEMGCYFSVNPQMAKSSSGSKLIASCPRERILTESDGPFVRHGPNPATPMNVTTVISTIASNWGVSSQQTSEIISENFKRILNEVPLNPVHAVRSNTFGK